MSHRDKYTEGIIEKWEDMELAVLADIAWSLHNIAAMLMEQNGYTSPYEYLNGDDINGGDDNERVS